MQDYEARIHLLRKRSNPSTSTQTIEANSNHDGADGAVIVSEHVDLFADHEDKQKKIKPMDEEKKQEQEKYEKQIGYLTYLGQDTNESLGTRSWYNNVPKRDLKDDRNDNGEAIEVGLKVKHLHDPMLQFLKKPFEVVKSKSGEKNDSINAPSAVLPDRPIQFEKSSSRCRKRSASSEHKHKKSKIHKRSKDKKEKKKKHKKDKRKRKHSTSESCSSNSDTELEQLRQQKSQSLQRLREERLQRERAEQDKTKEFLRQKFPSLLPPEEVKKKPEGNNTQPRMPIMKQKYNSQFNPFLAKQNYN